MLPVVQFTLCLGAGVWCGLMFAVPHGLSLALVILSAVTCSVTHWRGVLAVAAAVGIVTGGVVSSRESLQCAAIWRPGPVSVLLRVHDTPGSSGMTRASVLHSREGCTGNLRLRMRRGTHVPGGTRIVAVGAYRGRGVFRAGHVRVLNGSRSLRFALRDAVSRRIRSLYGERAGLVEAVVLGRREDIDRDLRDEFARSGLAHLLAISGLHVGVLGGWCMLVARWLGARRRAWAWGSAVVWLYVASLGFPAPATRAASFLSIFGLARMRQRHPSGSAVLALALMFVMLIDPRATTSVGAWLSAAAVWGTRAGIEAMPGFRILGASLGATISTAPITAYAFGTVAPVGIIANLAAVPLATLAVPGLFVSLAAGSLVAGGTGLTFALIEQVARIGSSIPGGNLAGMPGVRFAIPWFLFFCIAAWLHVRKPNWVVIRRRIVTVSSLACWGVVTLAFTHRGDPSEDLLIYFLSVGQGDAIAIRTPGDQWVLVDGGPRAAGFDAGKRIVVPFLRRHNVAQLAAAVLTHGDADHIGGFPAVIEELHPKLVLGPGQPLGTDLYMEYLRSLDVAGSDWRPARSGDSFAVDSVRFEVLHPSKKWISHQLSANENSVVLRVTFRCFSALLTGDIGRPVESILRDSVGRAALLKVAHHGSANSTDKAFLEAVSPRLAVISVGRNRFGHPSPAVLRLLEEANVSVYRTDEGGTVTIRSDGSYFESEQGTTRKLSERLFWLIPQWLRSNGSSSRSKEGIRRQRVNLPACSSI